MGKRTQIAVVFGVYQRDYSEAKPYTELVVRMLSELLGVPISWMVNMESDKEYQKTYSGDIVISQKIEVKINSYSPGYTAFKRKGTVLFEMWGNMNKYPDDRGSGLPNSKSDLWVHAFKNEEGTAIKEALIFHTKPLKEYIEPKEWFYDNIRYIPNGTYNTKCILVPYEEVKPFLWKHYIA